MGGGIFSYAPSHSRKCTFGLSCRGTRRWTSRVQSCTSARFAWRPASRRPRTSRKKKMMMKKTKTAFWTSTLLVFSSASWSASSLASVLASSLICSICSNWTTHSTCPPSDPPRPRTRPADPAAYLFSAFCRDTTGRSLPGSSPCTRCTPPPGSPMESRRRTRTRSSRAYKSRP